MNTIGQFSPNGTQGMSQNLNQHQTAVSGPSMLLANLNKNKIGQEHIEQDQKLRNQNQDLTNNFYPPQENYTDMNIQQPIPIFNQGNQLTQAPIKQTVSQSNGINGQQSEAQNIQQENIQQFQVINSDSLQGYNQNFNTIINNQNNMQPQHPQQNNYGQQPLNGQVPQQQQHPHHQQQPNQGFQQYTGAPPNYQQQHQNPGMIHHQQPLHHGMHPQHHPQQHHAPVQHHGMHHPQPIQAHPGHHQHQQHSQVMNNSMPMPLQQNHHMPHESDPHQAGMPPNLDPKRTYRKKKTWMLYLNITIETPELDNRLNESFEIEIGSNQRLKILHQTILSSVKNLELRELIRKEKTYIYIEGKEPVARKSKSLAEMGVKDGDHLIVTTEMKLPFDEISEDEDPIIDVGGMPPMRFDEDPYGIDNSVPVNQQVHTNPIEGFHNKQGQLTPPGNREPTLHSFNDAPQQVVGSNLPANQQENIGISSKKPTNHQIHNPGVMPSGFPQKIQNGANSVNGAIPKLPVKQPTSGGKDTLQSKKSGKKTTPMPTDKRPKEQNQPKSPAQRKPKDIQYVRILVLQQYFKDEDLKKESGEDKHEDPEPQPDNADEEAKPMDDQKEGEGDGDAAAEGDVPEKKDEEENQIDSKVVVEEEDNEPMEPENHEPELHDNYEQSINGENKDDEPYDPNDIWQLEVNSKNKVKSIKKLILEKIKLSTKKANILVYKKNDLQQQQIVQEDQDTWIPFTDADNDLQVKVLQGKQIAFKCYFDITVCVDGRGHSYKQNLRVDPKDSMDRYLKKHTHFWRIFMSRGQNKCIAGFLNKGDAENTYVAPDELEKSFAENGVANNCLITLYSFVKELESNFGEEGEHEQEEMEAEIEEMVEGEQDGEAAEGDEAKDAEGGDEGGVAQVVEESEDADIKKKASDVLFNDQNEKGDDKQE